MRNSEANGGFRNGSLISPDKEHILVSTQYGVSRIPLQKPDLNKEAPPVFILDGVFQRQDIDSVLTGGMNSIDIAFAGLRYASPAGVRYQYRMIGLSENWTDVFNREVVRFRNLKPGDYVFEVISWNEAGTISSEPARMRIAVEALVHQTLWFNLLVFLSLIAIIWVVVAIRLSKLKTIQERLETLVNQKTAELRNEKTEVENQKKLVEEQKAHLQELNDTKDRFFSIIGHSFRSHCSDGYGGDGRSKYRGDRDSELGVECHQIYQSRGNRRIGSGGKRNRLVDSSERQWHRDVGESAQICYVPRQIREASRYDG